MSSIAIKPLPRSRIGHIVVPRTILKRPRWNREMTIAAGFVCSDGVVMCADSQESLGDYKFPVEKLVTRGADSGRIQMALAGAGHGPFVDMAVTRIIREIRINAPLDYYSIEDLISDMLLSLYEKDFKLCPLSDPEEGIIELLIGIKLYEQKRPVLYKTFATTISEVSDYAVIGSGRAVQYQIHKLHRHYEATHRVVPIAINLLTVAGVVLRSVGGSAGLALLHEGEGTGIGSIWGSEIEIIQKAQSDLEVAAGFLTLDLLDVTKSTEDFHQALRDFVSLALSLREKRLDQHRSVMAAVTAMMEALSGKKTEPKPSEPQTSEDQQ
jgi:20S proteasome alpha/beta subunit